MLADEDVGGFEVDVDDVFLMEEEQAFGGLLEGEDFGVEREALVSAHEAVEGGVDFELEVHVALGFEVGCDFVGRAVAQLPGDEFQKSGDVGMGLVF